ncbi:MAG: family 65 glycosyl hydrolase domain-containing protein, partial [Bacteroidota bacterium]|nr:family 65 glycosyl hydrolase domain-containing protein [Bacteroidota bacterium]
QGNYISGIYYPDKTRVGWWKNGYPEYFAKVLNAPNWIGIKITIDGEKLDPAKCKITNFKRVLNMQHGYFRKRYIAELASGKIVQISSKRFLSIVNDELGVIKYSVKPMNFDGTIEVLSDVDADIMNQDSNYEEKFWVEIEKSASVKPYVIAETKKTKFRVCTGIETNFTFNNDKIEAEKIERIENSNYAGTKFRLPVKKGKETVIVKYGAIISSLYHDNENLVQRAFQVLDYAKEKSYSELKKEQYAAWIEKWKDSDIVVEGDVAAQQGIRYNIFQMNQTYTGADERLNIGPKGLTGEKYGGSTYWDTEAYMLPFYLSTANQKVARNLLMYRYKHLEKAIENAEKLGFENGAALYPMVTMNGEECHNEWEITFEEIHRNGAIAYAIYNYTKYTGDQSYLYDYGLEVLIAISRFWAQRINFSEQKQQYVMLGVTGPNEYENNVHNNWYTNTIACWVLDYTRQALEKLKKDDREGYNKICQKANLNSEQELSKWKDISDNMYYPYDEKRKVFLQQDGFLDKVLEAKDKISHTELPIHEHWSWDRILRSCYIKQADVLQGLYFFEENYDTDTIRRNYDFYEPLTVHESSLSSCVHSILAAKLGDKERAYEFYLNAARLDLDDYNNDTEDGLHITSMGGTWMSVIQGFGGMRIKEDKLSFNPFLPKQWKSFSFQIRFRSILLNIKISESKVLISNKSDEDIELFIYNESVVIKAGDVLNK